MFTNKKDPLVDSVRKVMEQNELRRRVEYALNEELGITSRNALPHEQRASYDSVLEEAYKCAMNESGLIKAIGTAVLSRGTAVTRRPGRSVEPYTGPVYGGKLKSTDVPKTSISGPKTPGPGVAFKTPTPEEPEVKQKHDNNKSDDTRYTLLPSGKMIPVGGGEAIDAGSTVKDYGGMKYPEYTRDKYGEFQGRGMPLSEPKSNKNVTDFAPSSYSSLNEKNLSSKQKQFAKLGTVTGEGGSAKEIDQHDLRAARKGHAHKVGLEEKITKSMSAGDVISDFVHSKNPKFEGKSKKERMKMALGAYYSKHPEKSKKMDESLESIMEEIRNNLEEQLVSIYESGDAQMFEEFVSSLTEEQIEILGLNENLGASVFGGLGDQAAASLANRPARAPARPAPTMTRPAARPSAPATAARPSGAPTAAPTARPSAAPAAGRPAPAPAARPAPATGTSTTARPAPAAGARAAAEVVPGEGRKPAPVTGEPPAGSPQYQGAKEAGAGNANLAPTPQAVAKQTPIKPTFEPRAQPAGTAASGTGTADLTPSPSTGIGKTLDGGSTPAPTPPTEKRGTAGAFARAAREQRLGSADIGQQQESTHIKESLESVIRSRYLKG